MFTFVKNIILCYSREHNLHEWSTVREGVKLTKADTVTTRRKHKQFNLALGGIY